MGVPDGRMMSLHNGDGKEIDHKLFVWSSIRVARSISRSKIVKFVVQSRQECHNLGVGVLVQTFISSIHAFEIETKESILFKASRPRSVFQWHRRWSGPSPMWV